MNTSQSVSSYRVQRVAYYISLGYTRAQADELANRDTMRSLASINGDA